MLANINYKGRVSSKDVANLEFPNKKPCQIVYKTKDFTIIIFKSGSCRIMGCREPIKSLDKLPFQILIERIQSITATTHLGKSINLYALCHATRCIFEPELFPAARVIEFNPLCVNVFSTGKIVVLGLKDLHFSDIFDKIVSYINDLVI
jgi:TATA-box binding protein (TBP) (component of TFIID and TFIIIB)